MDCVPQCCPGHKAGLVAEPALETQVSQENWLWFADLCLSSQTDGARWGQAAFWEPGEGMV